jgi:AbiU2
LTSQGTEFECELEIFRREEEEAQQHFFCWLAVRDLAARNANVLGVMNATPLFWLTTHHAMLLAAFVTLGRVFDQKSEHNLDRLMNVAASDLRIFSKAALQLRKEASMSKQEAAAYVQNAHALTSADIRCLKKQIAANRVVYEARYREIRNKVFAHNDVPDVAEVNKLFAKTNVNEMKSVFGFLHSLYGALDQLFLNGGKPDVRPYVFRLPPHEARPGRMAPGERVYREAQTALSQLRPIP